MNKLAPAIILLIANSSYASSLPNFKKDKDFSVRKDHFISYLLPIAQSTNNNILKDRQKLISLYNQDHSQLGLLNTRWLQRKCQEYNISRCDLNSSNTWKELLARMDVIPNSLLIAQAAVESGWGTSHFARDGNNLFGQWCFYKGCHLVNHTRTGHGIRAYSSVHESVESYQQNLNAGSSYSQLRSIRHNMRNRNKNPTGYELANGLTAYSTRGQDYINQIKGVIKNNNLGQYDAV